MEEEIKEAEVPKSIHAMKIDDKLFISERVEKFGVELMTFMLEKLYELLDEMNKKAG